MVLVGFPAKAGLHCCVWVSSQGVLGVRVSIMLPYDPEGKQGPSTPLPDTIIVTEPKPEMPVTMGQPEPVDPLLAA